MKLLKITLLFVMTFVFLTPSYSFLKKDENGNTSSKDAWWDKSRYNSPDYLEDLTIPSDFQVTTHFICPATKTGFDNFFPVNPGLTVSFYAKKSFFTFGPETGLYVLFGREIDEDGLEDRGIDHMAIIPLNFTGTINLSWKKIILSPYVGLGISFNEIKYAEKGLLPDGLTEYTSKTGFAGLTKLGINVQYSLFPNLKVFAGLGNITLYEKSDKFNAFPIALINLGADYIF